MSADEAFSAARNPPYFRSACTALLKVRPCRTDLVRPAEAVGADQLRGIRAAPCRRCALSRPQCQFCLLDAFSTYCRHL